MIHVKDLRRLFWVCQYSQPLWDSSCSGTAYIPGLFKGDVRSHDKNGKGRPPVALMEESIMQPTPNTVPAAIPAQSVACPSRQLFRAAASRSRASMLVAAEGRQELGHEDTAA